MNKEQSSFDQNSDIESELPMSSRRTRKIEEFCLEYQQRQVLPATSVRRSTSRSSVDFHVDQAHYFVFWVS